MITTLKTNLIICPNCEKNGKRQILGEIDEFGHLLVMRFHKGITRIIGGEFIVVCEGCGQPVYIKQEGRGNGREILNYWSQWFHRLTFGGTVNGTAGNSC